MYKRNNCIKFTMSNEYWASVGWKEGTNCVTISKNVRVESEK